MTSLWRHWDIKCITFACALNQTLLHGLRKLQTKNHALSTMCEIFTPSTSTIIDGMIYCIYGKLGTLWIIKNNKQIFIDICCNPFYVSTLTTVSTWSKLLRLLTLSGEGGVQFCTTLVIFIFKHQKYFLKASIICDF